MREYHFRNSPWREKPQVPTLSARKGGLFCSDAGRSQTSLRKRRPALHPLQLRPEKRGRERPIISKTKIERSGTPTRKDSFTIIAASYGCATRYPISRRKPATIVTLLPPRKFLPR